MEEPARKSGWTPELLGVLRCPYCLVAATEGDARLTPLRERWLICACGRKYPIADGIPVMMVEEGERWMEVEPERLPPRWSAAG